jgi:hypothetical protein
MKYWSAFMAASNDGAHLKLQIDGTTIFEADCHNGANGEVRRGSTTILDLIGLQD